MIKISTKRIGTDQLLNFSMPLLTPAVRMTEQVPRNAVWHTIGIHGWDMNPANMDVISSFGVELKLKANDLTRYSMDHPPTTL